MSTKNKPLIFDSWSILSFFEGSAYGKSVASIIADALERAQSMFISVLSIAEIFFVLSKNVSLKEAEEMIEQLQRIGIEFVEIDLKLAKEAAQLKSQYKIDLSKCFTIALAKRMKSIIISGDQELIKFSDMVKIQFVEEK